MKNSIFLFLTLAFLLISCAYWKEEKEEHKASPHKQGMTRLERFEKKLHPLPQDEIESVRIFALQNIASISDREAEFIQKNDPVIEYNELNMEYSFSWKFGEREILEVVTTPPPCRPIAAYRTNRIYYP